MHEMERVCPIFRKAIELVGKRWSATIIRSLMNGPRRFSELLAAVPGLHDRLLSERLRELESGGIVRRRVYPDTPVRIEYELADKGRDLEKMLGEIERWAHRWASAPGRRRR